LNKPDDTYNNDNAESKTAHDLITLSRRILSLAHKGLPRNEYIKKITTLLVSFCDCDFMELRVLERGTLYCSGITGGKQESFYLKRRDARLDSERKAIPCFDIDTDLERVCEDVVSGRHVDSCPQFTAGGSFGIDNVEDGFMINSTSRTIKIEAHYKSLAVIPFTIEELKQGLIILKAADVGHFTREKMLLLEEISEILGISFTYRRAQVALRERVKELTCLYGIAKVSARPGISLEAILQNAVTLLPPGWLYPHVAATRIRLDKGEYTTEGFDKGVQKQSADIFADGIKRGVVEIVYLRKMSDLDEGPFLKEERDLINAIANEIALIVERKEAEEEKSRLREQLRHADRLATIGQLAAGVAHELNEPLGSILGFAQLAQKSGGISEQVALDIDKIEKASLHAREIVRKLMIFARQSPPQKELVNLSQVVREGLYFLTSRCQKAGIELVKNLADDLPEIVADRAQMYQVLVNLVVNAIQSTPSGGVVTISTLRRGEHVSLVVEDNGSGMKEEVMKKIFVPFFTTKDVDEGTGLGLSVVHGIVAAHDGFVIVDSEPGKGSRFEVRLPVNGVKKVDINEERHDA